MSLKKLLHLNKCKETNGSEPIELFAMPLDRIVGVWHYKSGLFF